MLTLILIVGSKELRSRWFDRVHVAGCVNVQVRLVLGEATIEYTSDELILILDSKILSQRIGIKNQLANVESSIPIRRLRNGDCMYLES